ncbi:MAG TPA: hypothetical protein PLV45_16505 [bacterium]|nr:hypothetical protein [bacterium]
MYFEIQQVVSDKQGRITLPRSLFKTGRIIRGGALCVVPLEGYWIACEPERIEEILERDFPGSALDPDVRDSRREFLVHVKSFHIDPQGRVPFQSADSGEPGAEYVVVGAGREFEIWPVTAWRNHINQSGGDDEQGG